LEHDLSENRKSAFPHHALTADTRRWSDPPAVTRRPRHWIFQEVFDRAAIFGGQP
jgi:hypothetical protein